MSNLFNLEAEFGWLLDGIETYVDENPDDFLKHYGVKGMQWGKRKAKSSESFELKTLGPDKIVRKTKSGEEITLTKDQPGSISKFIAKRSKKYREAVANSASLTIRDSTGKKIGDASIEKRNADELYLNWIGIESSARGKGYATAVMKASADFGRESGFKKMTLEVPGNSPDARHIYEKLGFKVVKEDIDPTDSVWGGLTSMEYSFDKVQHREEGNMSEQVDDFLAHYGVAGMKWGKRKASYDDGGSSSGGSGDQPKQGMSRKKKIAIAVGVGATVAVGAAVAISILNNKQSMSFPVQTITSHASARKGRSSLIFNAAAQNAQEHAATQAATKVAEKAAKQVSEKAGKKVAEAIEASPAKRSMLDKAKEAAINKAKDMAYERAKEQAMDKAKEFAMERAKSMLMPASKVPQQPAVVFNPKTGLYEEVSAEAEAA